MSVSDKEVAMRKSLLRLQTSAALSAVVFHAPNEVAKTYAL
jgi:hypothetical protein